MIKAALFDMDGVLYDSMPLHARSWQETAERHHLLSIPADFYRLEGCIGAATVDFLFQNTFGRDATPAERHDIYKEKSELFHSYDDSHEMPGARELLEKAKAGGLEIILVTGSAQHTLLDKLHHSFPGIFTPEKMVTGHDVKYGKPHPEPYLMGLRKAGVTAREAIVVENAPMGIESAVKAGIFTVAVNTGPLPDEALLSQGAGALYPSMQALAEGWGQLLSSLRY